MDQFGAVSRWGRSGSGKSRVLPAENLKDQEGRSNSVNGTQFNYAKHIMNGGDTIA